MLNPLQDFVKYASTTRVKSHTRKVDGKLVHVDAHERDVEDKPSSEEERLRNLRARQAKELALWRKWKEGGEKPEDLKPLLDSFRPMIKSKANVYSNRVRIPTSAIEMTFQIEFVNALKSYDPDKGALGTYVYRYLDKGKRWITENQNIGRIPENRIYKIRIYQDVIGDLTESLGKVPNDDQVAKKLNWSVAEVERMAAELRNDLVTQGFEEDPTALVPSKTMEVLKLFKYELTGEQRTVYEHLTGFGKPQITSTSDLAKELKMNDYQVSRIKKQIETKLRRYINE